MPPKEKKKGTKKKEEAKFGDIERTQCDQDNSVRNTSQVGRRDRGSTVDSIDCSTVLSLCMQLLPSKENLLLTRMW